MNYSVSLTRSRSARFFSETMHGVGEMSLRRFRVGEGEKCTPWVPEVGLIPCSFENDRSLTSIRFFVSKSLIGMFSSWQREYIIDDLHEKTDFLRIAS